MQLKAYWIGNFIFDFLKIEFTVAITIILFYGFDLGYNAAWVTYLVLPFGILPFTYVTSFIFTADSAAQTFTMFFNFLILSIASTFIFLIRLFPTLQKNGDRLNLLFKLIPIYMVGSSVYCDSSCQSLSD
jgi:ATP-binding cassette, subfamily A (ABC1), member 3